MDSKNDFDAIEQRKISRKKFEDKKILKLQDEEIQRLKNELLMLKNHINAMKLEKQQQKNINKREKEERAVMNSLNKQIAKVSQEKRAQILKIRKEHTRQMNDVVISHFDDMNKLRNKYQMLIKKNEIPITEQSDVIAVQIIRNIEQTNNDIERAKKKKQEEKENHLANSLEEVKRAVQYLRARELNLRSQIDKEREKYIDGKQLNEQRIVNAKKILRDKELNSKRSSRNIEDRLLVENAKQLATLTELSEEEMKKLDPLRSQVREQQKRLMEIRTKIRDSQIHLTEETEKLHTQYNLLYEQRDQIETNQTRVKQQMENEEEVCVDAELRLKLIKEKIQNAEEVRMSLEEQNETLKQEIKRIDFHLYGKYGQYQDKTPPNQGKRRPFVPVGIYSN